MNCIITYKGSKYTQEQFKEYISNHKNEFSHVIASNKNVIDSFKRKMEGIDYVFSQSPELASIGSKAQYLQYLSTIFKTSKVKDIVYHGTRERFKTEQFDKNAKKQTTNTSGFWFTKRWRHAKTYTGLNKLIDVYTYEFRDKWSRENPNRKFVSAAGYTADNFDENIHDANEAYLIDRTETDVIYSVLLNITNPKIIDGDSEFINQHRRNNIQKELTNNEDGVIIKNTEDYLKGKKFDNLKETTYTVFEPEQIHILSSKKDLEMFKNFINFTRSEYAKYGDIQQFRDYIMSKNFAAIEEFLVVNNKIDRKC